MAYSEDYQQPACK